jgi:excisionase family DNA binding protein
MGQIAQDDDEDRLYSVAGAADWLGGLSKYTVEAWLSKGKLARTKVGSRTMIRKRDLQAFVNGCNPSPKANTRSK